MPAYLIARLRIHDQDRYERYANAFLPVFAPYGGRLLVASDDPEVLEGTWDATRTVVLEFPSLEVAKEWYESPAYQEILQDRLAAAGSEAVLVEGFSMPTEG